MPAFDAELPNDREFRSAFVAYRVTHGRGASRQRLEPGEVAHREAGG